MSSFHYCGFFYWPTFCLVWPRFCAADFWLKLRCFLSLFWTLLKDFQMECQTGTKKIWITWEWVALFSVVSQLFFLWFSSGIRLNFVSFYAADDKFKISAFTTSKSNKNWDSFLTNKLTMKKALKSFPLEGKFLGLLKTKSEIVLRLTFLCSQEKWPSDFKSLCPFRHRKFGQIYCSCPENCIVYRVNVLSFKLHFPIYIKWVKYKIKRSKQRPKKSKIITINHSSQLAV